jgi:hypothetical protein
LAWTWTGSWSWTARRLVISTFLLLHLAANVIWILPAGAIRQQFSPWARNYILPLGLWQFWAMFAPDPMRETITLEAEVIDANGVRYAFAFPRLGDYNWWRGIPRFRYSKYAANLSSDEFALPRQFAARHVLRKLSLPAEVYPVSVHLMYQLHPTPPPLGVNGNGNGTGAGTTAATPPAIDAMTPPKPYVLGTYRIDSPREVNP